MKRLTSSAPRRGRPTKQDSLQLRAEAFRMLLNRGQEYPENPIVHYRDAENALHVNAKTVRAIFRDIADISSEVTLVPEGIRLGRESYYHNNLRIERTAKNTIADRFVELVPPNVTLACSAGTTVAFCVKRLVESKRYHVIVTNSVGIIDQLVVTDISNLVFTGGEYRSGVHGCVGNKAVEAFKEARCEAALIGVSGVNDKGELFVRHSEEIGVLNQIVQSVTGFVFVVADIHKFTQEDTWRFVSVPELLNDKNRPGLQIYFVTNAYEALPRQNNLQDRAKRVYEALKGMGARIYMESA